jgi:signal peptidase I
MPDPFPPDRTGDPDSLPDSDTADRERRNAHGAGWRDDVAEPPPEHTAYMPRGGPDSPSVMPRDIYAGGWDDEDIPAALELGYAPEDVGLSADAYERTLPYETVRKRRRQGSGNRLRTVGRELAETIILALLIFFAVKAVIQNFRVEGASMEPSMHNNEYLLVNKAIYFRVDLGTLHKYLPFIPADDGEERHLFRAPKRGDVIVFRYPNDPKRDFIKRVIGVPGDTVEVRDGKTIVNGVVLKEDYIASAPSYTYGPKTVPDGYYFVLGDNRNNSFDSHAWGTGCTLGPTCDFVPEENIIGQAWVSYWPFDRLGFVNNKSIDLKVP